jgi:hypothetical protein
MRQIVVRAMGVVLMFVVSLPFSFAQATTAKKPTAKNKKRTDRETVLKAEEGLAMKVQPPARTGRLAPAEKREEGADDGDAKAPETPVFRVMSHPNEHRLVRARVFHGDLRALPQVHPQKFELREFFEEPKVAAVPYPGSVPTNAPTTNAPILSPANPAPAPSASFEGLDFLNWGAGHPPDTNGDVGPTYYIQTINTSIGIFRKSDGVRVAAFTFNTFLSQGAFGNLCDTNNFGDPVVLYDTFEDRWIVTDFAFTLSGGNPAAPVFQCFAVSKTGDPVAGGWNFYSIQTATTPADAFDDYPKFGIWPDGLYMSANMFNITGGAFRNARVWAFNKAQMYAGVPNIQVTSFDAPAGEFTMLPANARLQAGTPPASSPNYFATVFNFTNAASVYKFHVDWTSVSNSTLSGPFVSIAPTSWANAPGNVATPSPGTNIDTLAPRLMMQNQYSNIGGSESLWLSHTVRGTAATNAAPRYYQLDVTGGTVNANTFQAFTFNPDASAVNRFMPSVAVDRAGNMALGYSAASTTLFPAMRYAGRLAGDPVNTITQTETSLIEGTGTQQTASFTRWGDYSAMSLDPDGCTFWNTNMYYQVNGVNFNTRIGAFALPGCTPVGVGGTVSGTVTTTIGGSPISGATVALGSRTTTTASDGTYSFASIPAGTYPSITASFGGFASSTTPNVIVSDGATTTENFSLATSPVSSCVTDTTQADFLTGLFTNCDLNASPGDVILLNAPNINQQNTTLGNNGVGITITTWGGQTITPSATGPLARVDINLFCSGCTGATPNLTLSIRATTGGLPTGPDLVTATVTGFNSGAAGFHTATFGTPITLTAGTQYAIVIRPTANPAPGTYALTRSGAATAGADVYPGGTRVSGATSGTVWSIPLTGGVSTDAGFKVFLNTGFSATGTFSSSTKDANPSGGSNPTWGTISWNASSPPNTSVQFQVGASNIATGPFTFVGPDGTASTFFSNGGSLAQFNGSRYLRYQASFATTDSTVTPTLNDVTICFNDVVPTTLTINPVSGTFGGPVNLSATLTSGGSPVTGVTVDFTLNGSSAGSTVTDGSGIATLSNVSLTGINAGSYPTGIAVSFTGGIGLAPTNATAALTVAKADQAITFGTLADKSVSDPDFSVSATASSTLTVSFTASGNCTVTGATVHIAGSGACTITSSQPGDGNYNAATDVPQSFNINKTAQTITFGVLAGKTFGDPDFSIGATASSALTVSFTASGSCTVTGTTVHITGGGSCTITASQVGDATFGAAPDVLQTFSIAKASQTLTFGVLPAKTFGAPDFSVSATASSGLTVSFIATGNCTVTGATIHLTSIGSCTVTAAQAGNATFNVAVSVPRSFAINPGDDFNLVPTLPSVSVTAGQSITEHITVTPNPSTNTSLSFSCSGLPAKSTCSFTPNPVLPGSSLADVTVTISTTATTTASLERPHGFYAAWLGFASMGLMGLVVLGSKKNRKKLTVLGALALMAVLMAVGCGGKHTPVTVTGTPQGTSTVTVTGSTTGFTHSTTFTLTVN